MIDDKTNQLIAASIKLMLEAPKKWEKLDHSSLTDNQQEALANLNRYGAIENEFLFSETPVNTLIKAEMQFRFRACGNVDYSRRIEILRDEFYKRISERNGFRDEELIDYTRPIDRITSAIPCRWRLTSSGQVFQKQCFHAINKSRKSPEKTNEILVHSVGNYILFLVNDDSWLEIPGRFEPIGNPEFIFEDEIKRKTKNATKSKSALAKRRSNAEIHGLVMQAAVAFLDDPSKTRSRLESEFCLNQGTLSKGRWKTMFDVAVAESQRAAKELSEDQAFRSGLRKNKKKNS